jgi:hypothetical protein
MGSAVLASLCGQGDEPLGKIDLAPTQRTNLLAALTSQQE